MMGILMSETCWAHKKWNKIASDIKLVFYSSTVTMMHGPINIRFTLFVYSNVLFRKTRFLWDSVGKYGSVGQSTDDNIIRRMRIAWLDTGDHICTLRMCNTYCFSTATMIALTRLNVTSYVHWLSFVTCGRPKLFTMKEGIINSKH